MNLHRFNDEGVNRFGRFLDALAADPAQAIPTGLLTDATCVVPVPPGVEVEARQFANRMEAARYLHGVLSEVTGCDIERDAGLWAWLTLFYFDQVCPPDGHRRRKAGERARYVPSVANYQKYYRHLLAGPYRVYRAHRSDPDRALVLLCGALHKPGEIVEQIVARQEIITNPHAVELATTIYFDPESGSFKRGAAGKGGGSARRLADVLNQFDVTWDLYWMSPGGILAKLPREFDRFRPA
ncbi:MAG TPA: hypothetical protein PKK06_17670 [Phycisphaerae bacterium]|nr:hypothetical protein [Phycisphaerae bacterium]